VLTLAKFSARDAFVQACLPTAVVTVLNLGGVACWTAWNCNSTFNFLQFWPFILQFGLYY